MTGHAEPFEMGRSNVDLFADGRFVVRPLWRTYQLPDEVTFAVREPAPPELEAS